MTEILTHTDGTKWVACTAEHPLDARWVGEATVYHPDATCTSSWDGADDHYRCPHCQRSWWVEYDG
jgi:hypothetical protein